MTTLRRSRALTTLIGALAVGLAVTTACAPASAAQGRPSASPEPIVWDPESISAVYQPAEGFYAYAPSVVRDGDTEWIWTCHNDEHRVIRDHIYLTKRVAGAVVESRSVLQPGAAGAWDSFHTCDPSVVKGRFDLQGTRYSYAMFYLGNDVDASAHNQIGVAFAKDPEGPWIRLPAPIVTADDPVAWGVGQPTAISLAANSGRVLLAYTRGDSSTRAYAVTVDLSSAGRPKVTAEVQLPNAGLTGSDGAGDYLNGFDIALDASRKQIVLVREQHPYPKDNPWWIGASVQVDAIALKDFVRGQGAWTPLGDVDRRLTGFSRNHNAGMVRTWSGELVDPDRPEVVFTSSCSSLPTVDDQDWSQATCDSLYSYRLWSVSGER